jgi:hypothetical protein
MFGVAAARKIGKLRLLRKNPVRAQMYILATVLFLQNIAISRHKHGHRIGQQEHASGQGSGEPVGAGMANPGVLEVDRVHQMVERHMRITTTQSRQNRG